MKQRRQGISCLRNPCLFSGHIFTIVGLANGGIEYVFTGYMWYTIKNNCNRSGIERNCEEVLVKAEHSKDKRIKDDD